MKSLFHLGFTLALVISVSPAIAAASRCTTEQMQKMAHGGLLQEEITLICDTASALSQEEATEKLKAYAVKNSGSEVWYWIELPKPGNIALHDLNWYYQVLRQEGYVTRWGEDRRNPKEITLELTEKGKRFVQTGKSIHGRYSLLCCYFESVQVTCLTVDPAGDSAHGQFEATPSDLLMLLQHVATRYPTAVLGEVDFRRVGERWEVERVTIKTGIQW